MTPLESLNRSHFMPETRDIYCGNAFTLRQMSPIRRALAGSTSLRAASRGGVLYDADANYPDWIADTIRRPAV
jgi:hypothetical protein